MAFTNSSVLIYDNTANITASFETSQSTPYSVSLPASFDGVTLDAIVSRAGYSKNQSQFVGGGAVSFSSTPILDKDPDGTPAYTNTTDANITINFTFTPTLRCFIDIGDATVLSQTAYDMVEDAFETEDGCRFLAESGGARVSQAVLAGQTYFLLGQNIRLRRRSSGDVNAAIDAYVISQDGTPLDGTNGGVQFLVAQDINEIWNALTADYNTANTFGKLLNDVATRLDLDSAAENTYADDNSLISNSKFDLTKVDNGNGTFTVTRS